MGPNTAQRYEGKRKVVDAKSDNTVRDEMATLKATFKWLYMTKRFPVNLLETYKLPPIKSEQETELVPMSAIDGWFRACNHYYRDPAVHGAKGLRNPSLEGHRRRNIAMTLWLLGTAMRPVEATRIKMWMINKDGDGRYSVTLPKQITKTKKERSMRLLPTLKLTPYPLKDYAVTVINRIDPLASQVIAWGLPKIDTRINAKYDQEQSASELAAKNEQQTEVRVQYALQESGFTEGFAYVGL